MVLPQGRRAAAGGGQADGEQRAPRRQGPHDTRSDVADATDDQLYFQLAQVDVQRSQPAVLRADAAADAASRHHMGSRTSVQLHNGHFEAACEFLSHPGAA